MISSALPLTSLVIVVYLYTRAAIRTRPGGPLSTGRIISFAAGVGLLALALSPVVEELATRSLFGHMVQHQLLLVAPLPLLLGKVGTGMILGIDRPLRGRIVTRLREVWPLVRWLSKPMVATVVLIATVALWHLPAVFDATLSSDVLHGLEHVTFFGSALIYWLSLVGFARVGPRHYPQTMASVFTLALFGTALGALLTFATAPWFPGHSARASAAGLDWLADQQLAGVTMWFPSGMLLLASFLVLGVRWLQSVEEGSGRQTDRPPT